MLATNSRVVRAGIACPCTGVTEERKIRSRQVFDSNGCRERVRFTRSKEIKILDARLRNVVVCSINSMILFGERCNTFEIESGRPCSICSILISY